MILTKPVLSQSVDVEPINLEDLKQIDKIAQEYPILKKLVESQKETIGKLESSLVDEKKNNELNQREIYLQGKMLELKDQELAIERRANERLKEITDRAIKLAEISKPKSNWQLYGLAAFAGYIIKEILVK